MKSLYPVILAGGSGTRFWPLSREGQPKQFLALVSKQPLIVDTFRRLQKLASASRILVVCGKRHAPKVRRLLKQVPAKNVLVEPVARNTSPAIGLAAVEVFKRDADGVLAVMPSDHHVADPNGFHECIRRGAALAEVGYLVTLGIQPTHPETGFGYIRVGEPLPQGGRKVLAFVEKPTLERARGYFESGEFLWNGGIFLFKASVILEAFRRHLPQLARGLDALLRAENHRAYAKLVPKAFRDTPAVSIDYGVMEKADNLAVVPGNFGWSDVGSFSALWELKPRDSQGNAMVGGKAVLVDCRNCLVISGSRPVTLAAMSDCVVVDAKDVVLVIAKDKSQEVRGVVESVRTRGWKNFL